MKKISKATENNWKKLNVKEKKLEKRANKRMSTKFILPKELFRNKENIRIVTDIVSKVKEKYTNRNIAEIMYNFALNYLKFNKLLDENLNTDKQNVQKFIEEYSKYQFIEDIINIQLPQDEFDILGIIYQSLITEGDKNEKGSYYTALEIVYNMISKIDLKNDIRILDPCCGTGSFLLQINVENPNCIYGMDNDETAVIIAKANLIVKYKEIEFSPQIVLGDYILGKDNQIFNCEFDYIITNPPWGANLQHLEKNLIPEIKSGESFSYILFRACNMLANNGKLIFLLPESFLNVKVHSDIRKYLLEKMSFEEIKIYSNSFSGVVTRVISICLINKEDKNLNFFIKKNDEKFFANIDDIKENENFVIQGYKQIDKEIFEKINEIPYNTLENSIWGLGIVTGNNKKVLKDKPSKGLEPIYTGKEVTEYKLLNSKKFIKYDRDNLQQVASDDIYRAKEKLVYKFISKKMTFAYDDAQSLCLNSANILVPQIPNMGTKTVMAFLNSNLFQYVYMKSFGEIKILKGNLQHLPLPIISKEKNQEFENMVNHILEGDDTYKARIENEIYEMYQLNSNEIKHIEGVINGKIIS